MVEGRQSARYPGWKVYYPPLIFIPLLTSPSEPTAQALAAIFHELAMNPQHIDKIREEVEGLPDNDNQALAELPHLNAVIQEAMRLHPSLITGGIRMTTENGVMIGGIFIPPHITVVTPLYTISKR